MNKRVLVVDSSPDAGLSFLNEAVPGVLSEISIINQMSAALATVRNQRFDLILLGDRLPEGGDIYDVALRIKDSKNNLRVPVICVGKHGGRAAKIVRLLKPYAFYVGDHGSAVLAKKVHEYLSEGEAV